MFITAWSWIPDGEIIKGGKANNYAKIDTVEWKKKKSESRQTDVSGAQTTFGANGFYFVLPLDRRRGKTRSCTFSLCF